MYNIEHIRMFVEAVELGSFSASAKKLGKVQSAVSQGIANLEIDFNIQLFDRSTRKPTLTKEGRRLFKQSKAILLQMEDLNASVQSIGKNEEDIIKLALDDALLTPSLSNILNEFSQQFPTTEIELLATSSPDVIALINEQRADIGLMFTNLDFQGDIEPCFIGNLPFISVCHPDHDLAKAKEVTLIDLVTHRQLIVRGYKEALIDQFPIIAGKLWWANSFNAIKEMLIHNNLGWTYLPAHLVQQDIIKNRLVKINISFDHKTWNPPVDLVTSQTGPKGPAFLWLKQHLKALLD